MLRFPLLIPAVLALVLAGPAAAHEGHDHGAPPPPVSATIAPRADASSTEFEAVAVARAGRLTVYLDTFRGNDPVRGAEIEIDTPAGVLKLAEEGEGVYGAAAAWTDKPGSHDLALTISAAGTVDVLTATLVVPPPAEAAGVKPAAHSHFWDRLDLAATGLSPRDITMLLAGLGAGLLLLLATRLFGRGAPAAAVLLAGGLLLAAGDARAAEASLPLQVTATRDIAQRFPDGSLFVPKGTQRILGVRTAFTEVKSYSATIELPGRVIPDPNGAGYVQASVLGRLMPPPGGFPRLGVRVAKGDILAHVHPGVGAADVTSQQQQARDLDQQIALTKRRLDRLRALENVVARAQLEDAQIELSGLQERRANLDRAPRHTEDLIAPVSGVIAAVSAVAGQVAETNAVIFQIIDPARFWVEALSYEAHAVVGEATARLADGRAIRLGYRGTGLADRNQAIPIQFGIEGDARGLRAGQLVTVLATIASEEIGVALPREAVLRGPNGQPLVFEHTNAERFVPREVRTVPLDGARVLVVSGVEAGKRIVTQGAELLNQIR